MVALTGHNAPALPGTTTGPAQRTLSPLALGAMALLTALGSIVYIEPAPYDLLLIGLALAMFASGLPVPRELRVPALLLGLFLLGNTLAALLAPEPLQALRSLSIRFYMVLGFLYFASVTVAAPRAVFPALWGGYLVAAVLAVSVGLLEYYGYLRGLGPQFAGGLRAKAFFKDPNVYGPFLVPPALYCIGCLVSGRTRLLFAPLFLLIVFGLLLSFSRGAWINFGLAFALCMTLWVLSERSRRHRITWMLAALCIAAAATAVVIGAITFTSAADRFFQRAVITQKYDVTEGGRFYTQRLALARIGESPMGVGPGRSDEEFGLEPHNMYLQVPVEAGWLGGAAFIGLVALTLARSRRLLAWEALRVEVYTVVPAVLGMLAQSFFIDSTHWQHLWLLLALYWALVILQSRTPAPDARS